MLGFRVLFAVVIGLLCTNGSHAADVPATDDQSVTLPDTSDATHGLDLVRRKLDLLYDADFSQPLRFVAEAELFVGNQRKDVAAGVDWVLEGSAAAAIDNDRLVLTNNSGHLVFWNTRNFPADVLIEFAVSPIDSKQGLNILFFAAQGREGGGIFDLDQPRRDGLFKNYHSGAMDNYHVSYWATYPDGDARGASHIRKNHGFHLVSKGRDFIAGEGPGPHLVRVLKLGNQISVEVNGTMAVRWRDDGMTLGPVLCEGRVALRQMAHTKECHYSHFKVWGVK